MHGPILGSTPAKLQVQTHSSSSLLPFTRCDALPRFQRHVFTFRDDRSILRVGSLLYPAFHLHHDAPIAVFFPISSQGGLSPLFTMASSSSAALPGSPHVKQQCSAALLDKLAGVLPKGYKFIVHHLSTPPTRSDALCSPPPGALSDRTYRESHFLAVSIDTVVKQPLLLTHAPSSLPSSPLTPGGSHESSRQVLVLALEVYIFTTAWSTTIFVAKADSTGYLHLLGLPKGTPSPIREVSSAFVSYLVEERRRNNVQTVVSLFARAQNQYLFPGSIENKGKHVLDDRGLVRWWCRVLNSVMEGQGTHEDTIFRPSNKKGDWEDKKGYLVVPGLDTYESRAFLPRAPSASSNWSLNHPLERISHFAKEYDWVPPRCLVPSFPDDPKSRYRDELDLEASKSAQYEEKGLWRSVTDVDRFWEMMAFRQECSGGHMTGFLWVVFEPHGWGQANEITSPVDSLITPSTSFDGASMLQPTTPPRRRDGRPASTPKSSPLKLTNTPGATQQTPSKQGPSQGGSPAMREKKVLTGPIHSRMPRVKKHARNYVPDIPELTTYYYWPPEGRGTRIVAEADYKRSVDLLTKLDFETLELSIRSSKRWVTEVGGGQKWALEVIGRRLPPNVSDAPATTVNHMAGLVRKKQKPSDVDGTRGGSPGPASGKALAAPVTLLTARRKPKNDSGDPAAMPAGSSTDEEATGGLAPSVNLLVPRKKRKELSTEDSGVGGMEVTPATSGTDNPAANVLGSGLVRKKPKAS